MRKSLALAAATGLLLVPTACGGEDEDVELDTPENVEDGEGDGDEGGEEEGGEEDD